jgi:hypothetical protein
MNPIQMIMMLQQSNNPMGAIQQMASSDPLMGRAYQMGQGKNESELKTIVQNLAKQRGMNDNQLSNFLSSFGLTI